MSIWSDKQIAERSYPLKATFGSEQQFNNVHFANSAISPKYF